MTIIQFPAPFSSLSDEERQKVRAEAVGLAQILSSRLERIEKEPFELNDPLAYTVGDFYLLTRVLLLTRIELDERIEEIVQHLNGGAS